MGRLYRLSFLSVLIGPAFAQVTYPNCSAGWEWSYNSLNQNPCNVCASLAAPCNAGAWNIPPLPAGLQYAGPTAGDSTSCECNTVSYSLLSACAACQGSSWVQWSEWSMNCTAVAPPSTYPNPIPGDTRVPHWAYIDVEASNSWNITAAQGAGDSPEATPIVSSTTETSSTPSVTSPSSPHPNSNQDKSHGGEIAGAVVGAVASATLLTAFVLWYLRYRRLYAEAQPSPFASRAQIFGLQDNCTTISIGRYYDPSDPSTFPKPFVSPSAAAIQTISSSEGVGNADSIRSHERSLYPGLPLV